VLTLLGFIETTYIAGFVWLALAGAGPVSLDWLLFGRKVSLPRPLLHPETPATDHR
jgi:hypothetical protein